MEKGKLVAIWRKRAKKGPMDPLETVRLKAGEGMAENADQGRKRQVTILSSERWEAVMAELNADISPSARRANLLVSGIELADSRKKVLRIGDCRILIWGETRPCERMDQALPGLRVALKKDWGGGAFGIVLDDGEINLDDTVEWVEDGLTKEEQRKYLRRFF